MTMPTAMPTAARRLVVTLSVLAAALAGCGSTDLNKVAREREARAEQARTGVTTVGGEPTTTDPGTAVSPAAPGAPATPTPGRPAGSAPAARAGSTTPTPGRNGAAPVGGFPTAGRSGPGVTAGEIKIGITLVENAATFGDAIGVDADFGNSKAQSKAVIDYLNANGGIAGRKVKGVFYNFDLGNPQLADGQAEQEACAAWTEDDRVFAAVNTALARLTLLSCLAGKGVPGVHDQMPIDETTLAPWKDAYYSGGHVSGMTLDRLARTSTDVFGKRGFFGKDAVVGIVHFEDPAYGKVVDTQFKPTLAKYGVKKVVTQAAPRFASAPFSSYTLRFQQEGVTHVMFLGEAGGYPLLFMQSADSQGYHPKYGLRSDNFMGTVLQAAAPAGQLANVMGMGWQPTLDVDASHDPGAVSRNQTLCLDIMRKAGQDMSAQGPKGAALGYCNGLFLLRDAMATATELTARGFASAVAGIGTGFVSPMVFGTKFSSARHDGVDAYRDVAFDTGCKCFGYTSGVKRLS